MKKILPLGTPIIRGYANHAHISSILRNQSEQFIIWTYNYYVQLYVPYDLREFKVDYLIPSIYNYAPNLFTSRMERKVALGLRNDFINFINYYIDCGNYIYTLLDVKQIAAYRHTFFKLHDPLLYGYDDEKGEVYFADTYLNGKYTLGMASYDEVTRAVGDEEAWTRWGATDWELDVLCMKYKESGVTFHFDKRMYTDLLAEYIEERDSFDIHWGVRGWTRGSKIRRACGTGVYSFLQEYLRVEKKEKRGLDKRGFYIILEHKQILEKTIIYIMGERWEDRFPFEWQLLQSVINMATIMLNLSLKYNMTKREILLEKIGQYAIELEASEKILFPRLIELIKNS